MAANIANGCIRTIFYESHGTARTIVYADVGTARNDGAWFYPFDTISGCVIKYGN